MTFLCINLRCGINIQQYAPFVSLQIEKDFNKKYISLETDLLISENRILHIAPENNLRKWLSEYKNINYICGDLFPTDKGVEKIDITNIYYPDNFFDVIICSHVLEHILEDRKAMKELFRVLKPGGWAILQVPIALNLMETYEDLSITSPEKRLEMFGQEDHVRVYGRDYIDRLHETGLA